MATDFGSAGLAALGSFFGSIAGGGTAESAQQTQTVTAPSPPPPAVSPTTGIGTILGLSSGTLLLVGAGVLAFLMLRK